MAVCSIPYSCSDDNEPANNIPEVQDKEESVITCDITSLTFDANSGSESITFVTNQDWSAKVLGNVSWCTLSMSNGNSGTANIIVNVSENTTYIERNVSIAIQCGDKTHLIVVTQKQMDALLLNSSRFEVAQEGGTIVVGIKANIDYQWEIKGDAKNWIKNSGSRALKASSHTFIVEANDNSSKREGEICFTSGTQSETVKVYQDGESEVLMLTQNEYIVSAEGETIVVEIKSNVDFGVQMPNVDWIREEKSRALSSHTMRYVIEPNSSYNERSASIVFYDKSSSLKEQVYIVQKQRNAILLSNKTIEIAQNGGKVDAEVQSNINYIVEIASSCKDWISENQSRSLVSTIHSFTIASNETYDKRVGEIYFYDQARTIKETLVITQKQKDVISVSKKQYEVGSQANSIELNVFSNVEFDVTIEGAWIKLTQSSLNGKEKNHLLKFAIEENTTNQERLGKIIITDKNKTIKQEISIKQLMKSQQPTPEDKDPEGNIGDMGWG